MWKFNKYTIGDIVIHRDSKSLEFVVNEVLLPVPEEKGGYMYVCKLLSEFQENEGEEEEFNYIEGDLIKVSEVTLEELERLLEEAIRMQDWQRNRVRSIQISIDKKEKR